MTSVVLFPGLGSQHKGMGEDVFDRFPELTDAASEILGYSIRDRCLNDPGHLLDNPLYSQPAVFTVNAIKYRALCQESVGKWLEPDLAMGHDIGEYNALEAAGVVDFETGLRLIHVQSRYTAGTSGEMTVVLGLTKWEIQEVLDSASLWDVAPASLNAPLQTVLSGRSADIDHAEQLLFEAGAYDVRRLTVGAPLHSPLMAEAASAFADIIAGVRFFAPRFPVIANCTALPYEMERTGETLVRHIHQPVRWLQSIRWVLDRHPGADFAEVGDRRSLCKTIRQAAATAKWNPIVNPGSSSRTSAG